MNKKKVITIMMIALAVMVVGYAAFGTNLSINGTASIESNWSVVFTEITQVSKTDGVEEVSTPQASGTSATFDVDLTLPGDYIEYKIRVENKGNLNAIIDDIVASETGNEAISFEIKNIKIGDTLAKQDYTYFNVIVKYKDSITSQPDETSNKLTVSINYVQDLGQGIDSEDVIINSATLTTLSGNTTLSLANSAGRKLTNYTISGNSVQNGDPTPNTPVEVQSVGNKTKNLLDYKTFTNRDGISFPLDINDDGSIDWTGSYFIQANASFLESGRTYVFNCKYESEVVPFWRIKYTDGTYSSHVNIGVSLTTEENKEVGAILVYTDFSDTQYKLKMWDIQLEEGSIATDYEPYGYKIPVEVSGKNLFNKDNSEEGYFINSSGTKAATESYGLAVTEKIYVKPSTSYVYSGMGNVTGTTVMRTGYQYDSAGNPIKVISSSNGTAVNFTTETNCAYVLLQYVKTEGKPMLEEGTTATEYEPYVEPTTYNIYLDEPLNKIKISSYEYIDYIDFKTKNLTKTTKKIILTGNENWSLNSDYTFALSQGEIINGGYCTHYTNLTNGSQLGVDNGAYLAYTATLFVSDLNYSTVDSFKAYLNEQYRAGTPVTCVVGLMDDSVTKTIDLPTIRATEGTSTISIKLDNGVSVPISVEYYKK